MSTAPTNYIGNANTVIGGRHVPVSGTEAARRLRAFAVKPNEIHTTSDKKRMFIENIPVGNVWHGDVADQAAMVALNANTPTGRGVQPMDMCYRVDTGNAWVCAGNNGLTLADWVEVGFGSAPNNYFGTGADGDTTISVDTTLASDTGVDDTGIVIRNYGDLTIDAGVSLTAAQRVKAMLLYVDGDLTVNGTLHMDARGAAGAADDIAITRRLAASLFPDEAAGDVTWTIPATGAAGGATQNTGVATAGNPGQPGVGLQTGGGGSGSGGVGGGAAMGNGGAGAPGSAFCGGSGGGAGGFNGAGVAGSAGAANGADGGDAANAFVDNSAYAGGAGNPPGTGYKQGGASVSDSPGGGGGTLILLVRGSITVGAAGRISCDGARGGNAVAAGQRALGGGGAGGGIVLARYGGSYTLTGGGIVRAAGGAGGTASGGSLSNTAGGPGGTGSVSVAQIAA